MLAKSKLNSIDTLISQALIDMDISHKEFITILKEKDRYEMMKKNLKMKTYCLKCRKNIENIDPKISITNNGKSMIL